MKKLMKMFVLLLTVTITTFAYGQDVIVDGKTYVVNSKTQLNSDVEFGKFKQKNAAGTGTESFIKVDGIVSKTIFTEKELSAFLKNGTISSLGKIIEKEVVFKGKKSTVSYIEKNSVKVFFLIKSGEVRIREFTGNINTAKNKDGSPKPDSEMKQCYAGCERIFEADKADGWSEVQASIWLIDCQTRCDVAFSVDNPKTRIEYGIPLKGIAIQVK